MIVAIVITTIIVACLASISILLICDWIFYYKGLNLPIRYDSKHALLVKSIIDDINNNPGDWDWDGVYDIGAFFEIYNSKKNIKLQIKSYFKLCVSKHKLTSQDPSWCKPPKVENLPLRSKFRLAYEIRQWIKNEKPEDFYENNSVQTLLAQFEEQST